MRFSVVRRPIAVGIAVAVFVAPACGGGGDSTATKARRIAEISEQLVPGEVLGLVVGKESVSKVLRGARRPYIEAVALYSFRKDELLQATLQVSKFAADTDVDEQFQRTVAGQIVSTGADLPTFRMDDRTVYFGGNAKQSIAVWFRGRYMMILASRSEFDRPRSLLRALIDLDIGKVSP